MPILQLQPVFAPPVPAPLIFAVQKQELPKAVLPENPRLKWRLAHQLSIFVSPEGIPQLSGGLIHGFCGRIAIDRL